MYHVEQEANKQSNHTVCGSSALTGTEHQQGQSALCGTIFVKEQGFEQEHVLLSVLMLTGRGM